MAEIRRRRVILGGTALGFSGIQPAGGADDAELLDMDRDLRRLRSRCQRLQRQVQRSGRNSAWTRWSRTVDDKGALVDRIAHYPARGLGGIVVKVQALASELLDDGLILDEGARRRLVALTTELQRLGAR